MTALPTLRRPGSRSGWEGEQVIQNPTNDNDLRYQTGRSAARSSCGAMSADDYLRAIDLADGSADPFDAGWMRYLWEQRFCVGARK